MTPLAKAYLVLGLSVSLLVGLALAGCGKGTETHQTVTGGKFIVTCTELPRVGSVVLHEGKPAVVRSASVTKIATNRFAQTVVLHQDDSTQANPGPITITTTVNGPICPDKSGNVENPPPETP